MHTKNARHIAKEGLQFSTERENERKIAKKKTNKTVTG